ncbi:flavin reductase family protein [Rhizobium leguminosarum]|uniref:flavin reductase family protein n=1 Tax=Rhizobium leguminosarum TaxID=384 RepID=UPI001F1EB161|nr:flavin reductase family protein [Rhizobium leguminosarum]UIJ83248.1 flavin reductase family protein [Rhizobium leguminosarum]
MLSSLQPDTKNSTLCSIAVDPAILYMGTPVVLISSLNDNGTANLAPMSSAWWLGWGCMLGLNGSSKTVENILRTGQCVLNLPSEKQVSSVDRLALTTGSNPVPSNKAPMGFQHVEDKFSLAGLTPIDSDLVAPPRASECPVQLEAELSAVHDFGVGNPRIRSPMKAIEVRIVRVHAAENILREDNKDRIDPAKWRPLIMSFREFYGLGSNLHHSRLGEFPEELFKPAEFRRSASTPT